MKVDQLNLKVFKTNEEMGSNAGRDIEKYINELLQLKDEINIVFAAAPSQSSTLSYLRKAHIDWSKINALHLDEYHTIDHNHSAKFSNFLDRELFNHVNFKNIYYLNTGDESKADIITRYSNLFNHHTIDIVVCGVGENGHIAFNDPHVADFNDPEIIKEVELDEACRIQQVNDGCFPSLDEVPKVAITLTIPAIMSGNKIFCIVPGKQKQQAIEKMLNEEITEQLPASILRKHSNCTLYLDVDSYPKH